jgi:hypothetical protein
MNGDEALLRYDATVAAAAILGDKIVTSYFSGNAITSVLGGVDMTTTFAALDVTGNTGCNTFHGPYQVAGTRSRSDRWHRRQQPAPPSSSSSKRRTFLPRCALRRRSG